MSQKNEYLRPGVLSMTNDQFEWFMNLLGNPPPPIEELNKDFERYEAAKITDDGADSIFELDI